MSDETPPKFWEQILQKLGLEPFEAIENIRLVMNFMGYSTLQSISNLRPTKNLRAFETEVHKLLRNNLLFYQRYPNLKDWNIGEGTISVVRDIAEAAATCFSFDCSAKNVQQIQKSIHERCQKVASDLDLNSVMVDLESKPKREVMCPYCECITKLSLVKQVLPTSIPKFNTFNFDRHVKNQHLTRKRRALTDLSHVFKNQSPIAISGISTLNTIQKTTHTNSSTVSISSVKRTLSFENRNISLNLSKVSSPKTTRMMTLQSDLDEAQCKIKDLEAEVSKFKIAMASSPTVLDDSQHQIRHTDEAQKKIESLEATLQNQSTIVHALIVENILLRHKVMDASNKVRVFCRIKPSADNECFNWERSDDAMQLKIGLNIEDEGHRFNFDYVFKPEENNDDVFSVVKPLFMNAIEGFNVCIIVFGASGSGKSHTMYGNNTNPGIIPQSLKYLFEEIKKRTECTFELKTSCFEIYNEIFIDLLCIDNEFKCNAVTVNKIANVERVVNLKKTEIKTEQDFHAVLEIANKNRKTAATHRNADSSRSHAAIQIDLLAKSAKQHIESNILLLDLAGSENSNDHFNETSNSNNTKKDRKIEMSNINKSLSGLRIVVESLISKQPAIDFRSYKLTHFLKPYLTTNTKTLMITTASQETQYYTASKTSMEFAQSMGKIRTNDLKKNTFN